VIPRPSRRAALGAVGAAVAVPLLAACSVEDLRPTPPPTPPAPVNPDAALVADLVHRISALAAGTAGTDAAWHALHVAQLRALGHARPGTAAPTRAPSRGSAGAERMLRQELLDGCVRAHDPALARLLASMAAGMDQVLRSAS
jgi:hypothetical protein